MESGKTDQIKGEAKDAMGRLQRQAGEWTGNPKTQAKGAVKQAVGKTQKALGKAEEARAKAEKANRRAAKPQRSDLAA